MGCEKRARGVDNNNPYPEGPRDLLTRLADRALAKQERCAEALKVVWAPLPLSFGPQAAAAYERALEASDALLSYGSAAVEELAEEEQAV